MSDDSILITFISILIAFLSEPIYLVKRGIYSVFFENVYYLIVEGKVFIYLKKDRTKKVSCVVYIRRNDRW